MTYRDLLEAAVDPGAWERKEMEKPLHVRVAEALGWRHEPSLPTGEWWRAPDHVAESSDCDQEFRNHVPRYDTDWSATGPLIERLGIELVKDAANVYEDWRWRAGLEADRYHPADWSIDGHGPAPLIAVCNLILALDAAGKIPSLSSASPSP